MKTKIYTSESVTIGHPDKVCDYIADSILDECLKEDKNARVACEVMATKNKIIIGGEITTSSKLSYEKIAKQTVEEIGYSSNKLQIEVLVNEQSPDISGGVNTSFEVREQHSLDEFDMQGAGDQGIMVGYACSQTKEFMPLSFMLARNLTNQLTEVRQNGIVNDLLPDGKSQVTLQINEDGAVEILNVLISTQHKETIGLESLRQTVKEFVINPVFKEYNLTNTQILINPSGRFVLGGYEADTGVTGRKLQVDSYGTISRQGGGAYSGKDASKVDRSGAYICRYIAKNIVAANIAKECEVTLAYAIGKAKPLVFDLNFFNTQTKKEYTEEQIEKFILELVDLRSKAVIKKLNLQNPVYKDTVKKGHFGNEEFSWEQLDLKEQLIQKIK